MRNEKETVLDMLINPRTGDNFDRKQTQKQLLEALTNKNQQLNILHQVNTRLGYQLSVLQRKMGIDSNIIMKELEKLGDFSLTYHSDIGHLQYLDQLLLAYDETILKQKKIIAMLYSQLQDADRKSETIVRQNQYLLEENKNKCKKILQIYHRGYPQENLTLSYNKLLREMEQQKNLLIRQQSQHFMDAYMQLQHHSQNIQRQYEETKLSAEKYFQGYKKQAEQLKQALLSVDNLLKVKEFLQKTVNKLGEENINFETMKNQLQAKVSKLQAEVKSLRNQLFGQKKINRQDTERISIELDSLKSESNNAIKRQRQTFNRNMILEKELQNNRQSLRSFKRQNEKVKSQLEQTLKMCQTYESKITSQTRKQQSFNEITEKNKERLDNLLLERDKALLKIEQLEKIMDNMNTRNRQQLIKLRQNYQKMLSEHQEKNRLILQQKEESQSVFIESQLNYKNQIQKLRRQNSLLHDENIKFIENIHINTGSEIINKLKQYESKNDSLVKLINQKQKQLKDQQNKHEESIHQLENQIRNITRLLDKQKNLATQYMKQITQERSRTNILSNDKECLENQAKKLKKNIDYRSNQLNDDRQYRISDLENRLRQAEKKEKQTKLKAIEMLERYDESQIKLKEQFQNTIVQIEAQNQKLRKKIEKLKKN